MKKALFSVLAIGLLMGSCKKDEDSTPTPTSPSGTTIPTDGWKLGTTSYTTVLTGRSGSESLTAMDGAPGTAVNTFNVFFSAYPTTDGTFTIVQYPSSSPLTATQIGISSGLSATSTTYVSTGIDGISATVTISGGKIKVVVPEVWVKTTSGTDSLKLSGTLQEQ